MVATNLSQLERMLRNEVKKAMKEVYVQAEFDLKESVNEFYTGGTPDTYQRTAKLKSTPMVNNFVGGTNVYSFDAYLDKSGGYTTGKRPSMTDVLNLTNYGTTRGSVGKLRPAVGSKGYWEKAEKRIEKTLNSTMKKYFI